MIKTYVSGGINWNWYLQGDFDEETKTVTILFHDRWHKYEDRGSRHPKHENIEFSIEEKEKRIAYAVILDRKTRYVVRNVKNVFDYRDMTHYEPE